jgi:hypothetical protein
MFKSSERSAEMPKSSKRPIIDARAQQQAQHTATISLIVKNTGKIQKEIGFRRARLKVRIVFVIVKFVMHWRTKLTF